MYKQLIKKFFITICIMQILFIYVLPSFFTVVFGKPPGEVGYNEWNDIPEPYGDEFTYMGWQLITDRTSDDWQLIEKANVDYNDDSNYDQDGYGIIDGCYVIACTHNRPETGGIAAIGDYIDFELDNGIIINCIMGDEKSSGDAGWSVWGHDNGRCVVEFVVDERRWYTNGRGSHANPGQGSGELDKVLKGRRVTKYIRKGNYLGDDRFGGSAASTKSSYDADLTDFWGALKSIFGGLLDAVCAEYENIFSERNDITVRYDLNDKDDMIISSSSQNNSQSSFQNTDVQVKNNVVQYYQNDYPDVPYGPNGGTIATSGCSVTSIAMVVSTLREEKVTPKDVVDWCHNDYYVPGYGTGWAIYRAAAKNWNLQCKETKDIDEVVQALKEGKIVISSQAKGLFTNRAHLIVLTTIDSNGAISVNDPNKNNAKSRKHNNDVGFDNTTFTANEIDENAKSYWIYSK